ncbi:MAG: 16S rRNA (guanine(966)-N(2))-methyltransferase RsmD [Nitrospirae bacterium]|nr:16S rRNA (guanine(966)-N(2))-methyltransferase RsmD [Nitrospirota bacterium]
MKAAKSLRPTTGKVREALFNILRRRIEGAIFLDLYAGTGAVGLEALKQGAAEVVFVEAGRSSAGSIDEAIARYRFTDRALVITKKVLSFLESAEISLRTFDIIFLDPPYHTEEILLALSAVGESNILRDNGIVAAEHFAKRQLPDTVNGLQKTKAYRYGDTVLSFYEKRV